MSFPAITDLLPHRPPMLWVDEVIAHEGDQVQCRLTLRADHPFVQDGAVEPIMTVEFIAQTVGALVGLYDRAREQEPRPGYLIAVPEAHFLVESLAIGDVLELCARKVWGDETLASFEGSATRLRDGKRELAARAQLSVYRRTPRGEQKP